MSQEIFEIVQEMDIKDMELQIALQCAPMLAGLKLSNLLMIKSEEYEKVRALLKSIHTAYFVVASTSEKMAILLFDRRQLEMYLRRNNVWHVFQSLGYQQEHLGKILYKFRLRYEGHLVKGGEFPHEMGLLLGYPVEDVEGFMQDGGENCLYTGYWKVYQNAEYARMVFERYDMAREIAVEQVLQGRKIQEIVA